MMLVRTAAALLAVCVFGPLGAQEAQESDQALLKAIDAGPGSDTGYAALDKLMMRVVGRGTPRDGGLTYSAQDRELLHRLSEMLVKYNANRPPASNTALAYTFTMAQPAQRTQFLQRMYDASTNVEARGQMAPSLLMSYWNRYDDWQTPAAEHAVLREQMRKFANRMHADLSQDKDILHNADYALTALDFSIGDKLPALHVPTVDGGTADLAQQRGKIVIVDIWATWCVPCVAGQPALLKLKQELQGRPFEVFSLSMDKKPEDVLKHMNKQPMPWVNGYVGFRPPLVDQLGLVGFPGVFVLDGNGVIRVRTSELDDKTKDYIRGLVAALEKTPPAH